MWKNTKPKHLAFRAHDRHVVTCLQFDTDKVIAASDISQINVYDIKTGALRAKLEGHTGGVWGLEFHDNTLVSGSTDGTLRVWDIAGAECTHVFRGHKSTVRSLQILLPVQIDQHPDGTPVMMPEQPLIISGSRDSTMRVWKLPQPGDSKYLPPAPTDEECPYLVRVLTGHQHSVRALTAYGNTLVSGSYDCTVRVWKISTGKSLHTLHGHTMKVYSVALDCKRNRCISGSMDHVVKIWSIDTGALLYNLEGHSSLVGILDLKEDWLVSAAADATLRVWNPENGHCQSMFAGHTGAITSFQHDDQKVVSGSDTDVKMWDIRTGTLERNLLTNLTGVWQVKFDGDHCVVAVQRESVSYIEVLDFGAPLDDVPSDRVGKRVLVNELGDEIEGPKGSVGLNN
ncbi:hypothetical protein N7447_008579 [Penicillium robsamsonii]|uniref:uncharacterized protein n=1 Tax=Penicillium robsamsonii TaxID=1792511 RepID=UPI00254763DB|nr:uncharacterized protein N7447_008579 [Penicillium robsamsonii]KAJ5816346.1 hypothetical protein N7447_008579 [Penicillium robsamsonii]